MRLNEVLLNSKATLINEGEDWYISREISEFRGQQVETLYLTDEFGVTVPLDINEFTMEEFFGNNWIEYKGVEYNA